MFNFLKKLFSFGKKKTPSHANINIKVKILPCEKLNKIIENDRDTEKIVDNFEYRKKIKFEEARKKFNQESNEHDILWDLFQDLFLDSYLKDHRLLLNVEYQRGLLLQKEKLYKDAVSHYGFGLFYLLNIHEYSFNPKKSHECIEGREVYHAQEKFSNKLAICVRKGRLDEEVFFDSVKYMISKTQVPGNVSLDRFLQDIFMYLKDAFIRNYEFKTITYDLCKLNNPTPHNFNRERVKFRALIRKFKKNNDLDSLKIVLDQYYNLSVLVTICYGNEDCKIGVGGRQFDKAVKIIPKVCKNINFSYAENGKLENSSFISNNDWKTFINVFGENSKKFNLKKEFSL